MSHGGTRPLPEGRVALLFTDVQGSTALLHRLGDRFGDVLDEHDRVLRGVWDEYDGVEVDNEGDAFFVVFTDHARAVEAVTVAQQRLATADWPDGEQVKVRMALHSGEPRIRGRKYWGVDVHYAARLGSAAHGGQVLLSADMQSEVPLAPVQSLGLHGLKDFPAARRIFHLHREGAVAADFPPPRTLAAARSNLPTIDTRIIGRADVIADLSARLSGSDHLVTLIGPGGMGKTRTAVAVADSLAPEFPDGSAFVAMASLRHSSEVPEAIAEAIEEDLQGVDATTALAAHLKGRRLLLVLDNAEHLPDLAEVIAPLVSSSAGTRWLVTSQASLGLRAEVQVRLDSLTDDAAVELFLDRARARQPDFTVPDAERELLVGLCRELDGMPLALELAAARAPTVGLSRLAVALGADPERALGRGPADLPERQRGLQAALDWTISLLNDVEVLAYATCGSFAEAWSIDDLEMVMGQSAPDVWDALARLVDLALVVQRGDGRFTMPERVRRHATRVLEAREDEAPIRGRHVDLVLATVGRLIQHEKNFRFRAAMADLEDHLPEIQQALTWASTHDSSRYRMLLGTCGWCLSWFSRERPWLDDLIRFARADDPGDLAQARVWAFAGTAYSEVQNFDERRAWLRGALHRFQELDDHPWVCEVYLATFEFECTHGDQGAGLEALRIGHEYAENHDIPGYAHLFEDSGAIALVAAGDYVGAEARIRTWLDDSPFANWARAAATTYLGDCAWGQGRFAEAAAWYAEDLRGLPRSELGNSMLQVFAIATSCAGLGEDALAVELASGCARVSGDLQLKAGTAILPGGLDDSMKAAAERLTAGAVDAARARGGALDYDALIERALEIADQVSAGITVR
ncbi:ATP-binding protein [Nocardioides marmorisolisilvae]|uniref:Adenylate/guanylate cyclase domain-containing protein n=1 Tax=Nocardioides marmorisolisilvae TaxID=1542737 RepID=A0A3N0DVG3_9ACTN|nr:adenylate/guanylate cyclase domain-containing protein [Nocardioides marmorisolisilvae]RNL79607.1 adenylate/guanylate cyclase domain-containing protein [Nocardioides marmorisolisilvae]